MMQRQDSREATPRFSDLLRPHSEATFFAEYWEQQPLHIKKESSDDLHELLTLDAMDQLLSDVAFRVDECKIAREGQIIPASNYLAAPGMRIMGRAAADYIDAAAMLKLFGQGATLVFAQLNHKWPPLQQLKEELESALSATVIANVFLSNRNSQGFSVHYDSHDVFVVQLHGRKVWSLYDSPIELPTKSEAFGTSGVQPGPLASTVTLETGDVLYVPRGYFHEAKTDDTVSLHVTLGVHPYLWVDFISEMIGAVGSRWAGLRQSVPRNFMDLSEDERVAQIRDRLSAITDCNLFGKLAGEIYSGAVRLRLQSGPRRPRNHLVEIIAAKN